MNTKEKQSTRKSKTTEQERMESGKQKAKGASAMQDARRNRRGKYVNPD
jgi:hypothetical protein